MSSRVDPAQWSMLQQQLDRLLALGPDERAARLSEIADADRPLGDELASLLAQLDGDVLPESLPLSCLAPLVEDEHGDDQRIGQRCGAFVLDAVIGHGGSGVVYRAHRDSDYAQTVAIKLLQGGRLDAAAARRLQHERDVLSQLDHPGIVRLVDAGLTEAGRPFLALEFVDGDTWDRYLAAHRPPVAQQLQMFAAVCDAVAYAHQRLLVHRDIKPGNLMVDREGRPKLLDYGIAKLIAVNEDSTLTRDFGVSMTLAYAAPEQLRGGSVTTATDVHALGILLYETLAGAHPFRRASRDRDALRQAILDEAAPALLREPNLTAMPPAWRNDLARIVAMALEKDPQHRYASAREFGEDVRAVLDGRPVRARRATPMYLLRRFVGRHRVAVAAVATGVVLLVATTAFALWQSRVAAVERQRAERRFEQVHRFANVVLFDYQEGIRKLGGSLPMQQRLVADALRYLESLQREVGDDTRLLRDLVVAWGKVGDLQGNPYGPNLGDLDAAARSYRQAQSLLTRIRELSADDDETRLMQARLWSRMAELRHQATDLEQARMLFERALAAFAALPEPMRSRVDVVVERSQVLDHHGDLLGREGAGSMNDAQAARAVYEQASALRVASLQLHPQDTRLRFGRYQSELRDGEYWLSQNDLAQAERGLQQALATISGLVEDDPDDSFYRYEQALVHSRLVPVHEALGNLDASVQSALRAFATTERMYLRDPGNDMLTQAVSASSGWAARQLLKAGRLDEATPVIARQIEVNRLWLEAQTDSPEARFALALAYRRRAELQEAQSDFAGAIASHREALALQGALADLSPDYALGHALTMLYIGRNQAANAALAEARQSLQTAVDAITKLADAHPDSLRYREYVADASAQLAAAWWRAPADAARARDAAGVALAIWDEFARAGQLSVPNAERRAALQQDLARSD